MIKLIDKTYLTPGEFTTKPFKQKTTFEKIRDRLE